jgi:hypothetical protein
MYKLLKSPAWQQYHNIFESTLQALGIMLKVRAMSTVLKTNYTYLDSWYALSVNDNKFSVIAQGFILSFLLDCHIWIGAYCSQFVLLCILSQTSCCLCDTLCSRHIFHSGSICSSLCHVFTSPFVIVLRIEGRKLLPCGVVLQDTASLTRCCGSFYIICERRV